MATSAHTSISGLTGQDMAVTALSRADAAVATAEGFEGELDAITQTKPVTYAQFGVLLDGTQSTENDAAVLAAHTFANLHGLAIVTGKGTYKPAAGNLNIPIQNDVDMSALTVILDDSNRKTTAAGTFGVFFAKPPGSVEVDAGTVTALNSAGIAKGARTIPSLASLGSGQILVNTSIIDTYRYAAASGPMIRRCMYSLREGGLVLSGTQLSIAAGSNITSAQFIKLAPAITIKLPSVEMPAAVAVDATASHVLLRADNISTLNLISGSVSSKTGETRQNGLIFVNHCETVNINGLKADGFYSTSVGTYVVQYSLIGTISFNDCNMDFGWGCIGGSYVNKLLSKGGRLSRIDCHWQVGEMLVEDTEITQNGIYYTGLVGDLRVIRPTKRLGAGRVGALVLSRGDYGGKQFPGSRVIVEDAVIYGAAGEDFDLVKSHADDRNGVDVHYSDVEIRRVRYIDCVGVVRNLYMTPSTNSAEVGAEVYFPKTIFMDDTDLRESPLARFQPVKVTQTAAKVRMRGRSSNAARTVPNVFITVNNVYGTSTLMVQDDSGLTIGASSADYDAVWTGADGPYFDIRINNYDNAAISLNVPTVTGKVKNSLLIHLDNIIGTVFSIDMTLRYLLVTGCDIKPIAPPATTVQMQYFIATYKGNDWLQAIDNAGGNFDMSLQYRIGSGNTNSGTYNTIPAGFFVT